MWRRFDRFFASGFVGVMTVSLAGGAAAGAVVDGAVVAGGGAGAGCATGGGVAGGVATGGAGEVAAGGEVGAAGTGSTEPGVAVAAGADCGTAERSTMAARPANSLDMTNPPRSRLPQPPTHQQPRTGTTAARPAPHCWP